MAESRTGLDGMGIDVYEEHFWEFRPVRFEYLNVGLPALDALEYVEGENPLGIALMRISKDKAAWLGAEALRRIQQAPIERSAQVLARRMRAGVSLRDLGLENGTG